MYIFSPLINVLLKNISRRTFLLYIIILFILWSIVPMITHQYLEINDLLWFFYLYSIAAYIRIYDIVYNSKVIWIGLIVGLFFTYGLVIVLDIIGISIPFVSEHAVYFYDKQYLGMFALSVFVFLGFKRIYITKWAKIINVLAKTMFGIYLLSDHYYTNPFLWKEVFRNAEWQNRNVLIAYSIFATIAVMIIGCIFELLRQRIERMYVNRLKFFEELSIKICEKIEKRTK